MPSRDELLAELRTEVDARARQDTSTSLPGLFLSKVASPQTTPDYSLTEPLLVVMVQGGKRLLLGDRVYEYRAGDCLVVAADVPVTGHYFDVTDDSPALGVGLALRPEAIATFAVINTASVASIAFIFAQYTEYFVHLPRFSEAVEKSWQLSMPFIGHVYPLENMGVKMLSLFIIVLLTYINTRSVKEGGFVQLVFSFAKIGAILLMVAMIFFSGKGNASNFTQHSSSIHLSGTALVAGIIAAMSGAFAAYDGWNNIGFVAGEIKNPGRNIPKGLFIGLGICILLYVATNQAYLYMLPIDTMAGSSLVATDALQPVASNYGTGLIALLVMISTFGCTNGNILACPRVTFEMAREGAFFKSIGKVNTKHQTPANALWLHCVWTCIFVFLGSFDMLTDTFVFVTWIFYGFAAYGIFVLRKKMPDAERPYKAWGYPLVPALFVAFTAFYFVMTLYTDINNYVTGKTAFINSVYGIALTLMGVPLYFYFKKIKK